MLIAMLVGCGTEPDVRSVEIALGTTSAVTWAGVHAAGWARGEALACDDATSVGDAWSGTATIGPDCPVPGVERASGAVGVLGRVDADGSGELAADFTDADGLRPQSVNAFVTTADEEGLTVVYAGIDVAIDSTVGIGENALVTDVDGGDPADGADDRYTLNGAVQVVFAASSPEQDADSSHTEQVVFENVILDAVCGRNPTEGYVTVQQVDTGGSVSTIDELQLGFHTACDGTLDVLVAAGPSAAYTGSTVAIDLGG